MMKRTKEYTCEIIIIELKREREMKSLVEDETPSVCTERAKRCIKIDIQKERRRETVSSFRGKEGEHIIAALFFYHTRLLCVF